MAENYRVISHVAEVKAALREQLAHAAEICRGTMESHAKLNITHGVYDTPETWYRRTGLLRNSITAQVAEDDGDTCVVVGTNVEYAPYVELGTGVYASDGGGRSTPWAYIGSDGKRHVTSGMVPRPYLRPAVEDNAQEYMRIIRQELSR